MNKSQSDNHSLKPTSQGFNKRAHLNENLPILYSLRNCPYAMRSRMAIYKSQQTVLLRDIVLSNKPPEMVHASPKGTVPVLVFDNGNVLEESFDIMLWALKTTDPHNLLHGEQPKLLADMFALIYIFDHEFKDCLNKYRCAQRYREPNVEQCRLVCEHYIQQLETRLSTHQFLVSNNESLADIAIMPFIRQFAKVERQWYLQAPYPRVRKWLNQYLQGKMFSKVMTKYPLWIDHNEEVLFSGF